MPRMVWRRERLGAAADVAEGPCVRAFWRRVLIVSRGYREQSTVRPAMAPDWRVGWLVGWLAGWGMAVQGENKAGNVQSET